MPYGDKEPYITPGEVRSEVRHWLPTGLGLIVTGLVVLGVIAGGIILVVKVLQPAGNSIDSANVRHQNANQQILQNSAQYHDGWETKLSDDYTSTLNDQATEGQVPASDLPNVKAAVLGDAATVCYDYTKAVYPGSTYTDTPPDIIAWYNANCSGPAVSINSPLRK